jgi:hypothetical protein
MMHKKLLALIITSALALIAPVAHGEIITLNVPETNWHIRFDAPQLVEKYEVKRPNKYIFSAKAGGFNMSVLVEAPRDQGMRHEDCYNYYWPKTERSPMIAKSTVSATHTPKYYRVEYDTIVQFHHDRMRQHNVDYYFADDGKWVDVHISIMAPTPADEAILKTFDESLSYGK